MSDFRGIEGRRAAGGRPITLEEYHRQPVHAPNPPQRGSRLPERLPVLRCTPMCPSLSMTPAQ